MYKIERWALYKIMELLIFVLHFLPCIYGRISYRTLPNSLSRATIHVPKVINKMCLLIPDQGPCRSDINMYYFAPEKMVCSKFKWGGCQGNGNRFDTIDECKDTCVSKPGDGEHYVPTFCSLRFDYGFCFGELKRWYFDPKWRVCRETIYSGCGGNKNNFYTQHSCEFVCRFGHGLLATAKLEPKANKIVIINALDATTRRIMTLPLRTTTGSKKTKST